jgi:hypothetical protein
MTFTVDLPGTGQPLGGLIVAHDIRIPFFSFADRSIDDAEIAVEIGVQVWIRKFRKSGHGKIKGEGTAFFESLVCTLG